MSKITVIIKKVNAKPKVVEVESGYESISYTVGGLIELFRGSEILTKNKIDMYLNEEGKLIGLEPSIVVTDINTGGLLDYIMGNVFIAGVNDEGETVSLTKEQIDIVNEVVFAKNCILGLNNKTFLCGVLEI